MNHDRYKEFSPAEKSTPEKKEWLSQKDTEIQYEEHLCVAHDRIYRGYCDYCDTEKRLAHQNKIFKALEDVMKKEGI